MADLLVGLFGTLFVCVIVAWLYCKLLRFFKWAFPPKRHPWDR